MNPLSKLHLLACPDCKGNLESRNSGSEDCYLCLRCNVVFPICKDIPIILHAKSRNPGLERPPILNLLENCEDIELTKACKHTLAYLENVATQDNHAWEDEAHWSEEYSMQLDNNSGKNWNDRLWQREPMFNIAIDFLKQTQVDSAPRVVLDMGCGEGQDFRHFLASQMQAADVYIGIDISMSGLLLNRARNTHENAIFILASADYPPLQPSIADILIALGTLHHMEAKERALPSLSALTRQDSLILQSDPINGSFLPQSMQRSRAERSEHDDTLELEKLNAEISALEIEVVYRREMSGLVYFLLFSLTSTFIRNYRWLHSAVHLIDDLVTRSLGRLIRLFRPKGLLLVLKRK